MAKAEVDRTVDRVSRAQALFSEFSQADVDAVIDALNKKSLINAEKWARMAHEETGYGTTEDKTVKNRFCAEKVYEFIKPLKTVGFIKSDPASGIYEVAAPMGVVAGVIPSTNPTSTAIYKIMIALKARNGIVISPHPAAKSCIGAVASVLGEAAVIAGAPDGIIGIIRQPTIEDTQYLMRHPQINVILATGGMGLVNAAYSSGKPAYGVGPGNVPAFIERTAVLRKAVRDVIAGKSFDWGTICASEQSVIVDKPLAEEAVREFKAAGGYFVNDREKALLEALVVNEKGFLNPKVVGRAPKVISSMAGFSVPEETRALIVPEGGVGRKYPLSLEKLSPILSYFEADGWEAGCQRCIEVLKYGGLGHTLCLHTTDREIIRQFALKKPAFRIIINSSGTHGAVGISTNLPPAMTLGCGALGNNITSDNITPMHLLDIKRVAYEARQVSGEEPVPLPPLTEDAAEVRNAAIASDARLYLSRTLGSPAHQGRRLNPLGAGLRFATSSVEGAEDFVCEEDVKAAIAEGRKIRIHSRTVVTPSARDLGEEKKVFESQ